jgi:hypothetical protein
VGWKDTVGACDTDGAAVGTDVGASVVQMSSSVVLSPAKHVPFTISKFNCSRNPPVSPQKSQEYVELLSPHLPVARKM